MNEENQTQIIKSENLNKKSPNLGKILLWLGAYYSGGFKLHAFYCDIVYKLLSQMVRIESPSNYRVVTVSLFYS